MRAANLISNLAVIFTHCRCNHHSNTLPDDPAGQLPEAIPIHDFFGSDWAHVSSRCLILHLQYRLGGTLSIQFGKQGGVTQHQLGGEPKMRFVSTALVMTAIALMLVALTLFA